MEINNIENEKISTKTLFQLQAGALIAGMIGFSFTNLQFYYITIVLLSIELYIIANIIYTVWNMFNDPLLGHFCDKSTRWVMKHGKRYPFIVSGVLIGIPLTVFVFFVPFESTPANQILIFLWLLIMLCLADTFASLTEINLYGLIVDKIRDTNDRKKAGGIGVLMGTIGILLAVVFQPIILEALGRQTIFAWTMQILFFAVIAIIIFLLSLSGLSESTEMRERRLKIDTEKKDEDFFRVLKQAMKQRNFQALIILRVAYLTSYNIFVSTISFWIIYVLNLDLTANIIPMMLFILGGPITIPLWLKIGKKANAKIMFILGFLIIIVCAIPMMFIDSLIGTAIVFAILGAGAGCQAVFGLLIFSDTIEEAAIITGTRQEGIYIGINIFFIRTSIALQVFIVGIVLLITGFNPKATIQAPEALLGIRLLMSIIPGSILLTGVILFWILFNITPEKRLATQAKLKELGL